MQLLEIFPVEKIIAIGRKSESRLNELEIGFEYVRHPAFGGKSDFVIGVNKTLK